MIAGNDRKGCPSFHADAAFRDQRVAPADPGRPKERARNAARIFGGLTSLPWVGRG